jgi:hypothetical protein
LKVSKDENGVSADQSLCRSMIGSLLYLTASRPDITFVVGVCDEYIARSSCSQLVWMKQMLTEYNVTQDVMTVYYDNLSAINISKNPIQHSRTKHIDIRHHFIRELVEEKNIALEHVTTEMQLADIFTKALDANQFECLRGKLGICIYENL